jgi:hypothetical protein
MKKPRCKCKNCVFYFKGHFIEGYKSFMGTNSVLSGKEYFECKLLMNYTLSFNMIVLRSLLLLKLLVQSKRRMKGMGRGFEIEDPRCQNESTHRPMDQICS